MNEKGKVKIIKRGIEAKSSQSSVQEERTKRAAAREMVSNVSNWVNELQTRKSSEAKLAFENLFKQIPTPSES